MSDVVLDDGNTLITNDNGQTVTSTQPHRTLQEKIVDKAPGIKRDNTISGMLSDRFNNPPSVEQLQEFQNKLMGRPEGFAKLPQAEKERIMFEELQNWHFKDMPTIEQMKKELNDNPTHYEVASLNKQDTYGVGKPHVNLKNENVTLTVISDGKTISFNNAELLKQYRESIKNEELAKVTPSDIQQRGTAAHENRVFDD